MIARKPTSPGEILREEFLKPLALTQGILAHHIGCDVKVINRIVNERSAVTADMALLLAGALETTPDFWLNAQLALDLYNAKRRGGRKTPKPLARAKIHGNKAA